MREETDMLNPTYVQGLSEPDEQRRRKWVDNELARAVLFGDCEEATARAAIEHLRPHCIPTANPLLSRCSRPSHLHTWFVLKTNW